MVGLEIGRGDNDLIVERGKSCQTALDDIPGDSAAFHGSVTKEEIDCTDGIGLVDGEDVFVRNRGIEEARDKLAGGGVKAMQRVTGRRKGMVKGFGGLAGALQVDLVEMDHKHGEGILLNQRHRAGENVDFGAIGIDFEEICSGAIGGGEQGRKGLDGNGERGIRGRIKMVERRLSEALVDKRDGRGGGPGGGLEENGDGREVMCRQIFSEEIGRAGRGFDSEDAAGGADETPGKHGKEAGVSPTVDDGMPGLEE